MLPDIHNRPERRLYDKVLYEQHIDRVKNMLHPMSNRKIMDDFRMKKKIEKENYNILLRIAKSIQTTSIDNKLSPYINNHREFKKKLSRTRKRLEHEKITKDNQLLLKRIIEVPPSVTKYIS
jgi:hypothetical protein